PGVKVQSKADLAHVEKGMPHVDGENRKHGGKVHHHGHHSSHGHHHGGKHHISHHHHGKHNKVEVHHHHHKKGGHVRRAIGGLVKAFAHGGKVGSDHAVKPMGSLPPDQKATSRTVSGEGQRDPGASKRGYGRAKLRTGGSVKKKYADGGHVRVG